MKYLVIIPARGGSKGIPRKNVKLLNGKPLIQYTIEAAMKIFPSEQIIVSTDDQEIISVAETCGLTVPFIRPADLSTDTASSYDVILHAVNFAYQENIEFEAIVLLQPTSPFRNEHHILEAIALYSDEIDMVVSVKESDENPYYSIFEENENGYLEKSKTGAFTRRQDCPKTFSYNGAIYVINPKSLAKNPLHLFTKIQKYEMNKEVSIDLDTPLDWKIAEVVAKEIL